MLRDPRTEDLSDLRFGKLKVLGFAGYNKPVRGAYWTCICDCGTVKDIRAATLKNGGTRSCGCQRGRPTGRKGTTKFTGKGRSKHPMYPAWVSMFSRCNNPSNDSYENYGAKGVKVDDRWRNFWKFIDDVGERPKGMTLDRIDSNGNYESGNVRWANLHEQIQHRRNKSKYGQGISYKKRHTKPWLAELTVNNQRVLCAYFKTQAEAVQARQEAEEAHKVSIRAVKEQP